MLTNRLSVVLLFHPTWTRAALCIQIPSWKGASNSRGLLWVGAGSLCRILLPRNCCTRCEVGEAKLVTYSPRCIEHASQFHNKRFRVSYVGSHIFAYIRTFRAVCSSDGVATPFQPRTDLIPGPAGSQRYFGGHLSCLRFCRSN